MQQRTESVTVTVGVGNERHNHDVEYRSTLEHIIPTSDGVVEFVDYIPYDQRINEIMEPYIKQYNEQRDQKYKEAVEKFERGERRSKPHPKDFLHMSYNYAEQHRYTKQRRLDTGRVEEQLIFRSLIIGIGDQESRPYLQRQLLIDIFRKFVQDFQKNFPCFLVLGASLHLDERGFPHLHLDYFVCAVKENWKNGLPVYRGQEKALQLMKFSPEQSIITAEERPPILFNAFRNRIYLLMQSAMEMYGLHLQYGVTKKKDPYKNSQKNMRLEVWQQEQDRFRLLQQYRNEILEILDMPEMQPKDFKSAVAVVKKIEKMVEDSSELAPVTLLHGYRVTSELLERFIKATAKMVKGLEQFAQMKVNEISTLTEQAETLRLKCCKLELECAKIEAEYEQRQRNLQSDNRHRGCSPGLGDVFDNRKRFTMDEVREIVKQDRERERENTDVKNKRKHREFDKER